MAKTKGKYQTSFTTYEEFKQIFNSIPENDRLEWAENLDPELLRVKDRWGWTVAHALARSGTLPEKFVTDELLRMKNKDGWTVAHALARNKALPEKFVTEELIRMEDIWGRTVAHVLADCGTLPEKFVTEELLRMEDIWGRTVAHVLAYCGTLPEKFVTEELLRMKMDNGRTVAHVLAQSGTLPKEKMTEELLRVKTDNHSITVAHELAWSGTLPLENMTDKLFMMKDKDGTTVAGSFCDYLSQYRRWDLLTLLTPVILGCSYNNETSVVSRITNVLADMDERTLMETLSLMPAETILILADRIPDSLLRETIRRYIEKETEKEIFEIPSGTDDSGTEGDLYDDRDGLYEAERER